VDTLTLKSIQLEGKHGYYENEREHGNRFEVDIILKGNLRDAAESDDLTLTFDYQAAERIVKQVIKGPPQYLIESLCKKIGDTIFERFPHVSDLEIALRKLNPALESPAEYAEIRMKWQR
jgi:7,8-dihydroneopterin aldolase/epimerase/oxygenase